MAAQAVDQVGPPTENPHRQPRKTPPEQSCRMVDRVTIQIDEVVQATNDRR